MHSYGCPGCGGTCRGAYGFPVVTAIGAGVSAVVPLIGKALGPKTIEQKRAKLARLVREYQQAKTEKRRAKLLDKIEALTAELGTPGVTSSAPPAPPSSTSLWWLLVLPAIAVVYARRRK